MAVRRLAGACFHAPEEDQVHTTITFLFLSVSEIRRRVDVVGVLDESCVFMALPRPWPPRKLTQISPGLFLNSDDRYLLLLTLIAGARFGYTLGRQGLIPTMQSHLLEKALTVIKSEQYLVNIISRRVRQLSNGHKPMVEVELRMGLADIALMEVIKGKLSYEQTLEFVEEPSAPRRDEYSTVNTVKRAA